MADNGDPVPTVVNGHTFTIDTRYILKDSRILGKGSFGVVCTAYDSVRKLNIAIKRIRPYANDEWDAKHTLREIRLLKLLGPHPNIISLYELSLFEPKTELYMMMELMDCDLHRVIQSKQPLTEKHHKCFIKQVLEAIKAMHAIGVFHRDLKPGNILVSKDCQIRITDFGLARFMDESTRSGQNDINPMTEYVVTRWYRCPELLLSPNRPYSEAIDLWSIGCILAELIKRKPLFPGKSHAHQVQLVFEVMGYNTPADLGFPVNGEAVSFLDKRCRYRKQPLKNFIPEASPQAMELLEALLTVNPDLRPSAATALQHPFLADAEILNDYSRPYLRRPTADYFDFEHEKYTVGELKAMIEEDVHSLAANAYRLGAGGNTRSAAVASSNAMDRSSAQHTSSYDLQSGRDESDGPVSQLATQVKNTRLTSGPTNANSSHAHHSIAGSNMETAKTTKETNNNPFRPSYSTSTSTTTGRQSAEVAAINNGNILTAVRNDMIGGSNPAVANAMRSARKSTPKTPSPRKIDIILQKDQANKAKAMKEKEEEMVNTARSDTSSGIADGVAGGNLYANIFARRSGSSGTTASASNKATGDSTSKRFGRLMSAFPSLPGGGKSGNLHAANAITNSGRVYRGSNLDADRSSNPAQAKASIAMMHSGSNILHHDF